MQHKGIILSTALMFGFGLTGIQAQKSANTAGGEASGSGGSAAYSIGQFFYTSTTAPAGSVSQGVQQVFAVSEVTGLNDKKGIGLSVSAYPNPTTDGLRLSLTDQFDDAGIRYQLYGLNGKLLQSKEATGKFTNIQMNELAQGEYFLKVTENNKLVKTFKISKK